jgi:hypothetical protein
MSGPGNLGGGGKAIGPNLTLWGNISGGPAQPVPLSIADLQPYFPGSGGGGIPPLTSAHLFVGNGSNVATDVAASGDLTLANTGAFTVSTVSKTATASGTNTYTATLSPVPAAYLTGVVYTITFTNANTGAATLNLNSLGAKAIQYKGAALTGGEIPAGATVQVLYDGTQFQIVGGGTSTSTSSPDFVVYTILGGAL